MAKKMLIDATHAEETRVVVVDGNKVDEFDFETANRRQLSGNIYLAKVTRVEPSLQAAFVDYGGNRHGFLAFSEIHPDYYQIPVADREALREEERAYAAAQSSEENGGGKPARAAPAAATDTGAQDTSDVPGMTVVEPEGDGSESPPADGGTDTQADAGNGAAPYAAVDHAAELDDQIESVADEDVADEVRGARKPRPRRYKIQEVIKVRQILLVQVVKEERGNKGAALTTYLSLAGRYCVLMPNTARGGGISRKITNAVDRKKLKDIAGSLVVPEGAGLIIRTAGAQRTKAEIKRDYEYLMRLWEQIRELTLKSIAPAPIYEEGNLIKRAIRDLYNREIDEVWVEGVEGYRVAKDFMKMIMPSHARHVKHYTDEMPLFARYQVESYLASMFSPAVQLKSGGYIVIGITEALVAIDVNSGKATREGSIEETALRTNLEASEEIARQLRLRDLAGLIVIDFIDMEERRNNAAVEKLLKDKLKSDRARIQVGRISGFGLLEMSRQRLRPGMLESTTQPCPHCHGTGLIRSDDSVALAILRQIEEEGTRRRTREVLVRAPVEIANFLINQKREHIAGIEARYGMAVRIEGDPAKVSPDFTLEKFRTATRVVETTAPVVSVDTTLIEDDPLPEEAPEVATEAASAPEPEREAQGEEGGGKRKRRRRRRRRGGGNGGDVNGDTNGASSGDAMPDSEDAPAPTDAQANGSDSADAPAADASVADETGSSGRKPRKRGGRRGKGARDRDAGRDATAKDTEADTDSTATDGVAEDAAPGASGDAAPVGPDETPAQVLDATDDAKDDASAGDATAPDPAAPPEPEPVAAVAPEAETEAETVTATSTGPAPDEAVSDEAVSQETAEPLAPSPAARADSVPETPVAAETSDAAPDAAEEDAAVPREPVPAMAASDSGWSGSAGADAAPQAEGSDQASDPESEDADESRPRRRGWWNLGR